ncbi:UDP-4-amino-4,6-dideoxy-N-acetyl-beta-L-altrosamine N-acetyltransferase [Desulfonauticus submarinus]
MTEKERNMVLSWRNNSQIARNMFTSHIITSDEHKHFILSLSTDYTKCYLLVKTNDSYIGVIYLEKLNFEHKHGYLGLYVNPDEKGCGYGHLLIWVVQYLAFILFKLHTLKLEAIDNNIIAINLYTKHGFKKEGVLREYIFKNGEWKDIIIMGKKEDEFVL